MIPRNSIIQSHQAAFPRPTSESLFSDVLRLDVLRRASRPCPAHVRSQKPEARICLSFMHDTVPPLYQDLSSLNMHASHFLTHTPCRYPSVLSFISYNSLGLKAHSPRLIHWLCCFSMPHGPKRFETPTNGGGNFGKRMFLQVIHRNFAFSPFRFVTVGCEPGLPPPLHPFRITKA